jgi:hypothetical protein
MSWLALHFDAAVAGRVCSSSTAGDGRIAALLESAPQVGNYYDDPLIFLYKMSVCVHRLVTHVYMMITDSPQTFTVLVFCCR